MIIKLKKRQKRFLKEIYRRAMSGALAFVMLVTSYIPFPTYALTGGPSQPEVQGFTPIGTSDMVDLFSGDFKYNIPLLSVDGYPINIGYSGNIGMDQEASWVGLGWNLNVGTVNRAMRGIPDDFKGDEFKTTTNLRTNRTFGATFGVNVELFGLEGSGAANTTSGPSLSAGASVGATYNNYTGFGLSLGLDISGGIGPVQGGLGLQSSSSNGLTIQPNVSLTAKQFDTQDGQGSLKVSVGSAFNSRAGMQQLSINTSISVSDNESYKVNSKNNNSITRKKSSSLGAAGASFDVMQPTFTPQVSQSMVNTSLSGKFKAGPAAFGAHGSWSISGSYSEQKLKSTSRSNPAYGYMNAEVGQNRDDAMMDFNREKDGQFQNETPALPQTNFTYDIFSVSGQGVGGSFRPFRSDVGYVFDPTVTSRSQGGDIQLEVGGGLLAHGGGSISVNVSNSTSGKWTDDNDADNVVRYKGNKPFDTYEKYYMKEANELNVSSDPSYMNKFGGFQPVRLNMKEISKFNTKLESKYTAGGSSTANISSNQRVARERRNQTMQFVSRKELEDGYGIDAVNPDSYNSNDHHIAEVISLGNDGSRYVYGIAAYNKHQEEVSFAVGGNPADLSNSNNGVEFEPNYSTGLVEYSDNDASTNNDKGVDHYYNKVETPPYAHSYLLTSIISPDYVDMDGIKGPSKGDMGSYTKFHYKKNSQDYKWRTPLGGPVGDPAGDRMASYTPGLSGDLSDDKASYVYGKKELWYIDYIETKNFIAVFETSPRKDACGVVDKRGKVDMNNTMRKLDKITLYAKPDFEANGVTGATPIKEVNFEYSYELCPNVPNNANFIAGQTTETGKLTLKKVYFTYRDSKKGRLSPYSFEYQNNFDYNLKGYDRWGNYKPNNAPASLGSPVTDALTNSEFPYVNQDNPTLQDQWASAWTMNKINLPSGGNIEVEYESDDYGFVQDKKAMQMAKIIGVEGVSTNPASLSDGADKNRRIYFELTPGFDADVNQYLAGIKDLYFKCLMHFPTGDDFYEYVSGYATIAGSGITTYGGNQVGYIDLEGTSLRDKATGDYNPIARTGMQFGRMYLSQYIWNQPGFSASNQSFGGAFLNSFVNVFANLIDGFKNPNKVLWQDGKGTSLVLGKSWIRVNNVNGEKMGGGNRVAKVVINDEWDTMTSGDMTEADYGQVYEYKNLDGKSSGVASYEPQIGGEEIPQRKPVYYDKTNLMAPDDRFYMEEPFGESFYPSASVGYDRVVVKNLPRSGVIRHATGFVEHQFYTAKDFPTISRRTTIDLDRDKTNPFTLQSILKIDSRDFMTVSQGFYVECNDMHGKPKMQNVYQEDRTDPITSVEYKYKSQTYAPLGVQQLDSEAKIIMPDGSTQNGLLGVHFDAVTDFRQYYTDSYSGGLNVNLDAFPIGPIPVPVLVILPSFTRDRTQFRSSVMTKVVQRFGILDETIASDLGSTVKTKNLAYDGITGEVLLTETATNFEDAVYTLKFPAYWYYDEMGPAFSNIGYERNNVGFSAGTATIPNASSIFVPGDELIVDAGSGSTTKVWVVDVDGNNISVMEVDGVAYNGTGDIRVLRSGRRNQQTNPMASVTSRSNPITAFQSNIYENVIQASAIEFTDDWRTYCDCFNDEDGNLISTNPYVLGTKGNWRPLTSYLHLSGRDQSNNNNNTNIRNDGFFTSYTPFYKLNSGDWEIDRKDWTYTAEVTEFNPFGQELENQDALGRYSAATFGFNQTLATAVAANSRYREIGFDSFEDYGFANCSDEHFKFRDAESHVVETTSHSGNYSLKVSAGTPVTLNKDLAWCDDPGCDLDVNFIENGKFTVVQVTGGSGQYLIDWDHVSGDGSVTYSPVSSEVAYETSFDGSLELTISDTEGCVLNFLLVFENGVYTVQQ
jgi:hypothetical protein